MELPYLFGKSLMLKFDFNESDREMCDIFSSAFTNFAKYGYAWLWVLFWCEVSESAFVSVKWCICDARETYSKPLLTSEFE